MSDAADRCRLCGGVSSHFGDARILGKHDVSWFRCGDCRFVQSEQPYWLGEAYAKAITASDLGLASRNVRMARVTAAVINAFFDPAGTFVDFAGGYGLLVRLLRDAGYDFRILEPYCENLFAAGFEADPAGRYEMVTAFEAIEHLADPMTGFQQMAAMSDNILFSTVLLPESAPPPGAWWYYGLEHGQHIGIFSECSLRTVAARLGLHYCNDGREMHLLSRRRVPRPLFRLLCRYRAAILYGWWKRRPSLLDSDFEAVQRMPQ